MSIIICCAIMKAVPWYGKVIKSKYLFKVQKPFSKILSTKIAGNEKREKEGNASIEER